MVFQIPIYLYIIFRNILVDISNIEDQFNTEIVRNFSPFSSGLFFRKVESGILINGISWLTIFKEVEITFDWFVGYCKDMIFMVFQIPIYLCIIFRNVNSGYFEYRGSV